VCQNTAGPRCVPDCDRACGRSGHRAERRRLSVGRIGRFSKCRSGYGTDSMGSASSTSSRAVLVVIVAAGLPARARRPSARSLRRLPTSTRRSRAASPRSRRCRCTALIYTSHEGTTHLYRDGHSSVRRGATSASSPTIANQVNTWTSPDGVNWYRDRISVVRVRRARPRARASATPT